ncbi:hypothetical protein HDU99_006813, partial [Rhizoclosmatium hyalinum]
MSDYEASENETENESMAASYHYDDDEDDLNDDDELMDEFDDAPVTRDADVRRSYTVGFEVRTSEDLARVQQTEADDVGAVLGVSTEAAATLLRFFRWRKDRLLEDYYGNPDSDALLKRAGVVLTHSENSVAEDFECPVCFDVDCPVAQLKCAHAFCTACYARYLSGRITEEGESRRIQCPDASCSVIVDEKTVETLVDPKVFE